MKEKKWNGRYKKILRKQFYGYFVILFGLILERYGMKCVNINIYVKKCVHILWSTLLVCIEFVGGLWALVFQLSIWKQSCICVGVLVYFTWRGGFINVVLKVYSVIPLGRVICFSLFITIIVGKFQWSSFHRMLSERPDIGLKSWQYCCCLTHHCKESLLLTFCQQL